MGTVESLWGGGNYSRHHCPDLTPIMVGGHDERGSRPRDWATIPLRPRLRWWSFEVGWCDRRHFGHPAWVKSAEAGNPPSRSS